MNLYKITQLAKPIAVIVLSIIGYFQEIIFDKDVSNAIFLIIIGVLLITRYKEIKNGFIELYKYLKL